MMARRLAPILVAAVVCSTASCQSLTDYAKPGELDPLPPGTASLYRTPWRANQRTVSALQALEGIGVYYKHVPNDWTLDQHTHVMKQMAACGVRCCIGFRTRSCTK